METRPSDCVKDEQGNVFEYNPNTDELFVNGLPASENDYEPVFINSSFSDDTPPLFSGVLFKKLGKILGLNGRTNRIKM